MLTSCQLKREGLNVQVAVATIHGHNQRWWKTKWRPSSPLPTPPANPRGRGGGRKCPAHPSSDWYHTSQCPVPSPPTDDRAAGSTPENRKQGTPPPPTMRVGKNPTLDLCLLKQISPLHMERGPGFGRLLTSRQLTTQSHRAPCRPRRLGAGWRLILLRKSRTAVNRLLSRINAALTHLCPLSAPCKCYLTAAFDFSALLSPRGLWKQLSLHQSQRCSQTPPTPSSPLFIHILLPQWQHIEPQLSLIMRLCFNLHSFQLASRDFSFISSSFSSSLSPFIFSLPFLSRQSYCSPYLPLLYIPLFALCFCKVL